MEKMSTTTIRVIVDLLTKCEDEEIETQLVNLAFDIAKKEEKGGNIAV